MNEQRLVRKVLAGDQRAQQEFFLAYRDRLYRTCVHFLGYQDREAEDIVQEVFLIAHQKLAAFDFKHKLSTWLIQICVNLCFERLRQRKRVLLQEEGHPLFHWIPPPSVRTAPCGSRGKPGSCPDI
jgi:DNA-directed RNA polymerase specialized sigma24 family protein